MSWDKTQELTDEQVKYIKSFGGRIAMTSKATGTRFQFSIIPAKSGKGMSVNHLTPIGENNAYVGFITSQGNFIATKGSAYDKDHSIFQGFQWLWSHLKDDSYRSGCELHGC